MGLRLGMKKFSLFICALMLFYGLEAFHIVGGEIEFITIEPGVYRINLIQYRDEAQQQNTEPDPSVTVYIYSNKDNRLVSTHLLPLSSVSEVFYTNPECSIEELQTSRVVYTSVVELEPSGYADTKGYYVEWERCCRNLDIVNVENPGQTGMKYVVEIPPLWKNGKPFINSSPVLLKPLSDYACINQLYYTNFTGTDPDGDSLVYRLVTPLNSSSADALPIPQSKPHIPVYWAEGFSLENTVPGSPPLRITSKGLLTVNPKTKGLYVFSVLVEEWRDQVKIGEVQRDFQMLVREEGCDPPDPPEVGIQIPGNDSFDPEVDVLTYALEDDKCFDFIITNISAGEQITLRAVPVNFDEELDDLFSITQSFINPGQDTLVVQVCAPGCPPIRDGPFIIDLIASDDACPLPQMDTARLTINVEPPPNQFPDFTSFGPGYTINENEVLTLGFTATDADNDSLEMIMYVPGIEDPAEMGLFVEVTRSENGLMEGTLTWDTNCQIYDFSSLKNFQLALLPEDFDICEVENPNVVWLNMGVILPPNTSPEVTLASDHVITARDGDVISFDVLATDLDQDTVNLSLQPLGFQGSGIGVSFEEASGVGSVNSLFQWEVDCSLLDLAEKRTYEFLFIAEDEDRCDEVNQDTVVFTVNLDIPENNRPEMREYADTVLKINVPFEMDISAFDLDAGDSVTIEFLNPSRLPRSESLFFERKTGLGEVTSTLYWTPECSLLDLGEESGFFEISFLAYDDACPVQKQYTMSITFEVRETQELFLGFEPPNVFTPNGDGHNDTYTLTNLTQPRQNLPPDNCDDAFQYISIHDRSGTSVFRSEQRDFVWDGKNVPSGVYYYVIKYDQTQYKGFLQVLK